VTAVRKPSIELPFLKITGPVQEVLGALFVQFILNTSRIINIWISHSSGNYI